MGGDIEKRQELRAEPSGSKCAQCNLPVKAAEQDSTCSCAIEAKSQKVDLTTDTTMSNSEQEQTVKELREENKRLRIRNAALEERLRQHEELYLKVNDIMKQYAGIKGVHG